MKKLNTRAFGVVEVLILVLLLGVLAGGGWYIWHASRDKKTDSSTTRSTENKQPEIAADDYLTLTSFSVRLPLTSELSKLKLGAVQSSPYDENDKAIAVLAPQLEENWSCAPDANGEMAAIGMISVTKKEMRAGPSEPTVTKKIGVYTYGFEPITEGCTEDEAFGQLQSAFAKQFEKLEAY